MYNLLMFTGLSCKADPLILVELNETTLSKEYVNKIINNKINKISDHEVTIEGSRDHP